MHKALSIVPGILLCVSIGLGAETVLPGAMAIPLAIIAGVLIGNLFQLPELFSSGVRFCEQAILSLAIILMGVQLDFAMLGGMGLKILILLIAALAFTLIAAQLVGRWLGVRPQLCWLIGSGNGVCGCAAIVATERIVGADKAEVGAAMTVINLLGTIGMILLPLMLAWLFVFTETESGLVIGNTLQAVGQVVAAGYSLGEQSGQTATLIKMGRVLMLLPLMVLLMVFLSKPAVQGQRTGWSSLFQAIPWFIVGFVLMSIMASMGLFKSSWVDLMDRVSDVALITAMAAIGLNIRLAELVHQGKKALVLGSMVMSLQCALTLVLIISLF